MEESSTRGRRRFVSDQADVRTCNSITFPEARAAAIILNKLQDECFNSVNNFKDVLKGLEQEKANCPILSSAWSKAEKRFEEADHEAFREKGIRREYHIALIAYVLEEPAFYSEFNRLTRELKSESDVKAFSYKNYFNLLTVAVLDARGEPSEMKDDFRVFRGMNGRMKAAAPGDYIWFQNFISTSRMESKAQEFEGGQGTVFVIDLAYKFGNAISNFFKGGNREGSMFVCLDHISPLIGQKQEWECLLSPYDAFKVTKVDSSRPDGVEYIYMVRLTNDSEDRGILKSCVIS